MAEQYTEARRACAEALEVAQINNIKLQEINAHTQKLQENHLVHMDAALSKLEVSLGIKKTA